VSTSVTRNIGRMSLAKLSAIDILLCANLEVAEPNRRFPVPQPKPTFDGSEADH
jgi:hypothetical protein